MAAEQIHFDLNDVLGPFILGGMWASLLFGIQLVQTTQFFTSGRNERPFNKLTVLVMTTISTAAWACQVWDMWWLAITSRPSELNLVAVPILIYIPTGIATISQLWGQVFFAMRSWQLWEKNIYIGGLFSFLIAACLAFTLGAAAIVFTLPKYVFNGAMAKIASASVPGVYSAFQRVAWMHEADMMLSAVTDICISSALAWKMSQKRQGFRETTDHLITRVIAFSVSTAAITAAYELATAITMLATIHRNTATYFWASGLPHIYCVVTVTSLNLRPLMNPQGSSRGTGPSGTLATTDFSRGMSTTMKENMGLDSNFAHEFRDSDGEHKSPFPHGQLSRGPGGPGTLSVPGYPVYDPQVSQRSIELRDVHA